MRRQYRLDLSFSGVIESGVGAGIDSYYEYCLKSYVLLGDEEYLRRFRAVSLLPD